jgi:hypothetical protein
METSPSDIGATIAPAEIAKLGGSNSFVGFVAKLTLPVQKWAKTA